MTKSITVSMPSDQYPFFMELVDRLGFVSLSYEPSQDEHLENLLSDLKESFKEVSLHQQGKLQLPTSTFS